jgi:tetratricopeptide (TPR) repeat protein
MQMYQNALALQSKNQDEKALGVYSQILNAKPDIAEVHFQIGRIFFKANQFTKSVKHFALATQIKPHEPGIWDAYIPSLLCNVDPNAIKIAAKQLKAAKIDNTVKLSLQNRLLSNANGMSVPTGNLDKSALNSIQQAILMGDYKQANDLAQAFQMKNPKHAVAAELLARSFLNLEQYDQARKFFSLAASLDPSFFNAHNNLGQTEMLCENYAAAIPHFRAAVSIAPHAAAGICNLAEALARTGSATIALGLLKHAKALHLKGGKVDLALGELHTRAGKYSDAQKYYKVGLKREGESPEKLIEIGDVFNKMEQLEIAYEYFDRASVLAPSNHEVFYRKANTLRQLGHFETAIEQISKAIALSPKSANYLAFYTATKKIEKGDPIIDQMISLLDAPETPLADQTDLSFGIVKALEDSQEYDRVFPYLKRANDGMQERYPYDVNDVISETNTILEYCKDFKLSDYQGMGDPDAQPIFVCGMPRSGTTLVEQIISSHSDVIGGGEVGITSVIEKNVLQNEDMSLKALADVGAPELQKLGTDIWHHLTKHFPGGSRVSDKSILTYKRMGILKAAMPNCKIIVVRRDPRDNLLSIYRNQFFEGTHLYAYDLSALGTYYKEFLRNVDFWREKMPDGFMEIQYEDLIDDPEKHARELIDYCDLEWQDECLNFHNSKRQVKTLSVMQVRQPIYKSSVKAWERYEEDLQPLFEALK